MSNPSNVALNIPGKIEESINEGTKKKDTKVVKILIVKGAQISRVRQFLLLLQVLALICTVGVLIPSVRRDHKLNSVRLAGVKLWKWCVLVLFVLTGKWVSEFFIYVLERSDLSFSNNKKKELLKWNRLYLVLKLKRYHLCVWLAYVYIAWFVFFTREAKKGRINEEVLRYVARTLLACLVAAIIWSVKTLALELVEFHFNVSRFFKSIKNSIAAEQALMTLFGKSHYDSNMIYKYTDFKGEKIGVIYVDRLKRMEMLELVTPRVMNRLIEVIVGNDMTSFRNLIPEFEGKSEYKDALDNVERMARTAADKIFMDINNKKKSRVRDESVGGKNPTQTNSSYIEIETLFPFWSKSDVEKILRTEQGWIKKSACKDWVMDAYMRRYSLIKSLVGSRKTMMQLSKIIDGVVLVTILLLWLLLMGFLTMTGIVYVATQMLLFNFVFGDFARSVFHSIIFIFVHQPFYVGDLCIIEGNKLMVDEVNIVSTTFLTQNGDKVYYLNSTLAGMAITNCFDSPYTEECISFRVNIDDDRGQVTSNKSKEGATSDSCEILIVPDGGQATSDIAKDDSARSKKVEDIFSELREKIKKHLESKPKRWNPEKLELTERKCGDWVCGFLYVHHAVNYQNLGDRSRNKTKLIEFLKQASPRVEFVE